MSGAGDCLQVFRADALSCGQREQLLQRPSADAADILDFLKEAEQQVQTRGDTALREYSKQFDGAERDELFATQEEFEAAEQQVSSELLESMQLAASNILAFHKACQSGQTKQVETTAGVRCWREVRPIGRAGLYVPGGSAPLFSSLLMMGIPAKIAGVPSVVACTPPKADGSLAPEILCAARICGIEHVAAVGGAQAIFALAHGTKEIQKVDKIFGPGNRYVTGAKMLVSSSVAIDMPAGPSEVLVVADCSANAAHVAADLLSQAEHGADSVAVLVTDSAELLAATQVQLQAQLARLPRASIARRAAQNSFALVTKNLEEAMHFSNDFAPEHLILNTKNAEELAKKVQRAGSVFVGPFAPESFGDYASGTNHVLPTAGFARSFSGVSVASFQNAITFQTATAAGAAQLAPHVARLARAEGLEAHAQAALLRTEKPNA